MSNSNTHPANASTLIAATVSCRSIGATVADLLDGLGLDVNAANGAVVRAICHALATDSADGRNGAGTLWTLGAIAGRYVDAAAADMTDRLQG